MSSERKAEPLYYASLTLVREAIDAEKTKRTFGRIQKLEHGMPDPVLSLCGAGARTTAVTVDLFSVLVNTGIGAVDILWGAL